MFRGEKTMSGRQDNIKMDLKLGGKVWAIFKWLSIGINGGIL
jgi:hypothetical protein